MSGCDHLEKRIKRISVRVPASWKKRFQDRGIAISEVVRSALWMALNQTDPAVQERSKVHSLPQAGSLFNQLLHARVRTFPEEKEHEIRIKVFKTPFFREKMIINATPQELILLGEFLDQGEYAEEVLQQAYK